MKEFLNNLNQVSPIILSVLTGIYVILTWRLVKENQKMREIQTEPKISIIVEPREDYINILEMIIENIGQGIAQDVRFEAEPDFEYAQGLNLSEMGIFKYGLKYLAPKQKIRFYLTNVLGNFEEKMNTQIIIKVSYKSTSGKKYEDTFPIEFKQFENLISSRSSPLYDIEKSVKGIKEDLHRISNSFDRLKVIIYTKEDIEEEKKQLAQQFEKKDKEE